MVALYARFGRIDGKIKGQFLVNHLIGTCKEMITCLNRSYINSAIKNLVKFLQVDFNDILEAVKIIAVFHDIGKVMYEYQKQVNEILNMQRDFMSFQYHEIISSYILAKTFSNLSNFIFINPRIQQVIIQAILLHHQGLRTLNIEELNAVKNIINDEHNSENNIRNLNQICNELIEHCSGEYFIKIISEKIRKLSRNIINNYYQSNILIGYYSLLPEGWIKISRVITGCLIIADVKDAHKAIGDKGTNFIRDIFKF